MGALGRLEMNGVPTSIRRTKPRCRPRQVFAAPDLIEILGELLDT